MKKGEGVRISDDTAFSGSKETFDEERRNAKW